MLEQQEREHILKRWLFGRETGNSWEPLHDKHTVFLITTKRGEKVVFKDAGPQSQQERLESMCKVTLHLFASGVPVAVPYLSDTGRRWVIYQERLYTLSPYLLPSHHLMEEKDELMAVNIGKAIGQFHHALATYSEEILSWRMDLTHRIFEESISRISSHLTERQKNQFDEAMHSVQDEMKEAFKNLPEQYIHGDCHGGNILLFEGRVVGFVDLDHIPWGPKMYDLGCLLADQVKKVIHDEAMIALWIHDVLQGYEQINTLSPHERRAIWSIMLAVQLLMSEWFLEHQNGQQALFNFDVFYRLLEQKKELLSLLA